MIIRRYYTGILAIALVALVLPAVLFAAGNAVFPFFQAASLDLWFEFEGDVTDSSGNGFDGTASGAVTYPTTAVMGSQCLDFGAAGTGRVTVGNQGTLNLGTALTVTFWVRTDGSWATGSPAAILERYNNGPLSGFNVQQYSAAHGSLPGRFIVRAFDDTGGPAVSLDGTTNLADSSWHHIAVVLGFGGGLSYLYVDGALDDSGAALASWTWGTPTLVLGDPVDASYLSWMGSLDDFRYYTTALSAAEIDAIYQEGVSTVSVSATDATATEAGPTTGTFTFTRTGDISAAQAVTYGVSGTATSGTDYTALGAVTIAAGSRTATLTVTPIDDSLGEGDETVIVTVQAAAGYTVGSSASDTVTIADDDATVTIASTTNAREPTRAGTFTVTRANSTSGALTVTYNVAGTATAGTDYTALSGTVVIADGSATNTITVSPIDDILVEGGETIIVTLATVSSGSIGTPAAATMTLRDDDGTSGGSSDDDGLTEFLCSAGSAGAGSSLFPLMPLLLLAGFLAVRRRF